MLWCQPEDLREFSTQLDHAMPPCSTNRSVIQLFKENMPPILTPGTHNQKLVHHQPLMRPFVLSLGTRDEKRLKTGRKKWMLPLLPEILGFDFASYHGAQIDMERGREKGGKRETEQCGHARCLLVYLSCPSTLQQLTQQGGGLLPTEPRQFFQISHKTCTRHACRRITFLPAVFFNPPGVYNLGVISCKTILTRPSHTTWFQIDLTDWILLNSIAEIQCMPVPCISTLNFLTLPPAALFSLSTSSFCLWILSEECTKRPALLFLPSTFYSLSHLTSISSCSPHRLYIITHLHKRLGAKLSHKKSLFYHQIIKHMEHFPVAVLVSQVQTHYHCHSLTLIYTRALQHSTSRMNLELKCTLAPLACEQQRSTQALLSWDSKVVICATVRT